MTLDATSTTVATAVRAVVQLDALGRPASSLVDRSEKQAANSPAKNISSDASHTTTPTPRGDGGVRAGAVGWAVTDTPAVVPEARPTVG